MKNTKSEKPWAHTLSKAHLGKYLENRTNPEAGFYLVETGNCKPETGNQKKKMGPWRAGVKFPVLSALFPVSVPF